MLYIIFVFEFGSSVCFCFVLTSPCMLCVIFGCGFYLSLFYNFSNSGGSGALFLTSLCMRDIKICL